MCWIEKFKMFGVCFRNGFCKLKILPTYLLKRLGQKQRNTWTSCAIHVLSKSDLFCLVGGHDFSCIRSQKFWLLLSIGQFNSFRKKDLALLTLMQCTIAPNASIGSVEFILSSKLCRKVDVFRFHLLVLVPERGRPVVPSHSSVFRSKFVPEWIELQSFGTAKVLYLSFCVNSA